MNKKIELLEHLKQGLVLQIRRARTPEGRYAAEALLVDLEKINVTDAAPLCPEEAFDDPKAVATTKELLLDIVKGVAGGAQDPRMRAGFDYWISVIDGHEAGECVQTRTAEKGGDQ